MFQVFQGGEELLLIWTFTLNKNLQYKTHWGGKIWKRKKFSFKIVQKVSLDFSCMWSQEETTDQPQTGLLVWFPDRQINQWCTGPTTPTHITHCQCLYSDLQVWGGSGAGTCLRSTSAHETQTEYTSVHGGLMNVHHGPDRTGPDWTTTSETCPVHHRYYTPLSAQGHLDVIGWAAAGDCENTCSPAVDRHSAVQLFI